MSKFRLIAYREGQPVKVRPCPSYGAGFEAADKEMKADPRLEFVEIVQVIARVAASDALPKSAQEPSL